MCIGVLKNKWKKFEPTAEYLSIVSGLTSILKLHNYSKNNFKYIAEKRDKWKAPIEFMADGGGDCEDWARWYIDILVRIIKVDDPRFVIHSGYNKKRWGDKKMCHAITVLPYSGKLALFSNQIFKTRYQDFIGTGHYTFPDGLKYQEVRDWQGKVLEKKSQWFGTF